MCLSKKEGIMFKWFRSQQITYMHNDIKVSVDTPRFLGFVSYLLSSEIPVSAKEAVDKAAVFFADTKIREIEADKLNQQVGEAIQILEKNGTSS
jgi:hypothetical protein